MFISNHFRLRIEFHVTVNKVRNCKNKKQQYHIRKYIYNTNSFILYDKLIIVIKFNLY